jgi:hypothetical protein
MKVAFAPFVRHGPGKLVFVGGMLFRILLKTFDLAIVYKLDNMACAYPFDSVEVAGTNLIRKNMRPR